MPNLAGRAALASVSAVILFAAAGCSVTLGTVADSPSAGSAATDSPSAGSAATDSPSMAPSTALSPLCTDLSKENGVDLSDVQASLTYWAQVVADSPPDIVAQAQAVEDGFNKIADGTSPDDQDNNNAINDAIGALESWSVDNCPS